MKFLLLGMLFSLFTTSVFGIDQLTLSANKDTLAPGETFEIVVTANGVADEDDLDVSPVEENFELVEVVFDKYSYLVNLQLSNTSSWFLRLKPKFYGVQEFPALSLNGVKSDTMEIQVERSSQASVSNADTDVRIETELFADSAIVGQDVVYAITIYQDLEVIRPRIYQSFPASIQARQIGKDENVVEYRAGQQVTFMRRFYLLKPQDIGRYTIPSPTFTGIARQRNRGNFGRIFSTEKDVSIQGASSDISVQPAPEFLSSDSLVASKLTLSASWQQPSFQVGNANVLTLTLSAHDLYVERLPDINVLLPSSLRSYPENSVAEQSVIGDTLVASLTKTLAVIPSVEGEIKVPQLSLPWYNVSTGKMEEAVLDFEPIQVEKGQNPVRSNVTNGHWYTDFRLYLSLFLAVCVAYVVHVRLLLKRMTIHHPEQEISEVQERELSLSKMLTKKQPNGLDKALKRWLDDKFRHQPSLTHHRYSDTLKESAPILAELIEEFYTGQYGNGSLEETFFQRLQDAINQVEKQNKRNESKRAEVFSRYPYIWTQN